MSSALDDVREHLPELRELCLRFGVRRLELFGSATRDDFDPKASDLDFLVEIEPNGAMGYADAYFGFRESLVQLFGRRIDLVTAGAVRNPHFREAIERTRRPLYAA
jgi:predicted nucleotidyltransferase